MNARGIGSIAPTGIDSPVEYAWYPRIVKSPSYTGRTNLYPEAELTNSPCCLAKGVVFRVVHNYILAVRQLR